MSELHFPYAVRYNEGEYMDMHSDIYNKKGDYQYFKGGLFFKDDPTTLEPYRIVVQEISYYISLIKKQEKYLGGSNPLKTQLRNKILEFELKEAEIYNTIAKAINKQFTESGRKGRKKVESYPIKELSVREKISLWTELFSTPLDSLNGDVYNFSNYPESALYYILLSGELYDYLKNSKSISSVLSREKWEEMMNYVQKSNNKLYDTNNKKNMKQLEDKMWEAFNKTAVSKTQSIAYFIYDGFSKAIDSVFQNTSNKNKYVKTLESKVQSSYNQMRKDIIGQANGQVQDYSIIHDALKKWAEEMLIDLNKTIENLKIKDNLNIDLITEVKVGAGDKFFLTIKAENTSGNGHTIQENFLNNFFAAILSFLRKERGTVQQFKVPGFTKKIKMSKESIDAAYHYWAVKGAVFSQTSLKSLLQQADSKIYNSNSILSGLLGEIAVHLNLKGLGIESQSTGKKQQKYYMNGEMKSSGESFSDLYLSSKGISDPAGLKIGFNIKNYVTKQSQFKLASSQTAGLKLNSIQLRRYLSPEEINLLEYVQANQKLLSQADNVYYPDFNFTTKEVGDSIIGSNIPEILRITSSGFSEGPEGIINYIIVGNGYYIPASCIFQYALHQLQQNDKIFYEILKANPLDYEEFNIGEKGDNRDGTIINPNDLTFSTLLARDKFMIIKLHDFTVSISQLLKL